MFANDGRPAVAVDLADPTCLFQGPDGTLYFDEPSQNRLRGFQIGGAIRTIAGTGDAATPPLDPRRRHESSLPVSAVKAFGTDALTMALTVENDA